MAFNTETPRVEYTASAGQELFTFSFKIYKKTDLVVYQTLEGEEPNDAADILTVDVDYTVTISGDSGGEITLTSAATAGDALTLLRELPAIRDVEYQTNGDLLAETLNDDQDYQTYLIADLQAKNDRAMVLSESAQGVSNSMPPVVAQYFLRWNSAGTALENAQAVVQEITEFNDTDFRLISTGNKKLIYDLAALTVDRTWTAPDKDIDFGEFYTKTESDAITDLKLDASATAQTKIGDLTIGETVSVDSWSYDTTTITVNTSAIHNLIIGQYFSISGLVATTNAPNGRWQVATIVDTDTITFTAVDTPTGSATVSSAELSHGDIEFYGVALGKNACTAWVNFDGTTTPPTIADSFNVDDVVRSATGKFEVYFKETMNNANYVAVGMAAKGDTSDDGNSSTSGGTETLINTVDKCYIRTVVASSPSFTNSSSVSVYILGGKS